MVGRTSTALLLLSLGVVSASVPALTAAVDPLSTALDDYMAKPEAVFNWSDTGARITTLTGGTGHVLNVTSLTWLDVTRAYSDLPSGRTSVWTHQVIVVVPKKLTYRNISLAYLTGSCNENPKVPSNKDEDLIVADTVAKMTEAIAIVVYQIPNCKVVFPSDPSKMRRGEDDLLAWGWNEFLQGETKGDPEWLPRLPMTKAAMAAMRASTEYLTAAKLAEPVGWFVAGASKRGWTTWMVGATTCPTCVNIAGIAPLVPIVPSLMKEMHRQFMSYGGWTFAFEPYINVNLTSKVDSPEFANALRVIDPMFYGERLKRLPKFVVLSSDDEFMQFDWSNIWWNDLTGEKHLTIINNAEHSLATGIPEVLVTLSNAIRSIAVGHQAAARPSFTHSVDNTTGAITVKVTGTHNKVYLRHAETQRGGRRDFRWVRLASNTTGACTLPQIPLKKPVFGGNCVQPIIWRKKTLSPSSVSSVPSSSSSSSMPVVETVYTTTPPAPKDGHWTGYYVEVFFPSDGGLKTQYQFTTAGYAWPNTLPFADCTEASCTGHKL